MDVLEAMQADERLRQIPVIIYSAASDRSQEQAAMKLGAKAYLVKGVVGVGEILTVVGKHAIATAQAPVGGQAARFDVLPSKI